MPLKVSDGIGTWIDDFKKSKAPQFKGKSEKERRDMAIAAYLSAKRGGKPQSEDVRSADKKPEKYIGPDGKPKIRMVPVDREIVKSEAKRVVHSVNEESDKSTDRLKMLVRLGLMDKKDMTKIVRSISKMKEDKPVSPADRKILFDLLNELIGMVTGDEQMFQKAKKAVREEKDPNEYDKEGEMMKNQLRQICSANEKLMKMVGDDDNLPEWVQNKVTKATDYIRSVRDYLEAENGDDDEKEMDEAKRTVTIDKPDSLASIRVIKPKAFKDMRRSSTGK